MPNYMHFYAHPPKVSFSTSDIYVFHFFKNLQASVFRGEKQKGQKHMSVYFLVPYVLGGVGTRRCIRLDS